MERNIPILQPVKKCYTCIRCSQYFVPPPQAKKGSAQFYRCQKCLTMGVLISDYVDSCSIC